MPLLILFIFIVFPILEIAGMIQAGRMIGVLPALLLIIGGVVLGVILIRAQSFALTSRMVNAVRQGLSPAQPLTDSGFIVLSGLLFMAPGFISDIIAVLLLLPPIRALLTRAVYGRVALRTRNARPRPEGPARENPRGQDKSVIDVEFTEVTPEGKQNPADEKPGEPRNSPWNKRR